MIRQLRARCPHAELIGFDSGYFAHNLTGASRLPEASLDRLHFGDIRDFPPDLLDGVDAVVHLAAISNDPMGKEFEAVTEAINEKASVALAQMAQERGVGTFRLCFQLQHLRRRRRAIQGARAMRSIL